MRVFVTGASGHIASAVIPELQRAGHKVVGLARSDEAAAKVAALDATPLLGDVDDVDLLAKAATEADGVIHLAFKHELNDIAAAAVSDLCAVQALGDALEGTGKPFVETSGTLALAFAFPDQIGTENDVVPGGPRIESENLTVALANRGVRSSVVRLAPLVHSSLDKHGFTHRFIAAARQHGFAAYIGDGTNRWPALHTLDAGTLYRAALESAPAGTRLHGTGDDGIPMRDIAATIARHLDVPIKSITAEEAGTHFAFIGSFVGLDNPTSNEQTRRVLDWEPTHPGLIADLDEGHYFAGTS